MGRLPRHGRAVRLVRGELHLLQRAASKAAKRLPLPGGAQQRRRIQGNNRRIQHKHRRERLGRYALGPIGRGAAVG